MGKDGPPFPWFIVFFVETKNDDIMALTEMAIAGAAVSALGQGISQWMSRKENEKYRKGIDDIRRDWKTWYNVGKNESSTRRADTQAYINQQRELFADANNLARATNRVSGGSEESLALQKEANNKAVAQTTATLAAQNAAEKRADEQAYRQAETALAQQAAQTHSQQAAQNAAAGAQAVNAGINLMGIEARNMELNKKPVA